MPQVIIGSNAEAGVYVGTLKHVSEPYEKTWPDGTQSMQLDWEWVLPNGEPLKESTSTATGPKSKLFQRIVALNNGRAPLQGEVIDLAIYYGRRAILTVEIKENGWPKIGNVGPMPLEMQQADFAATTGAPVSAPAPQQLRPQAPANPAATPATVSPLRAADDDLGF